MAILIKTHGEYYFKRDNQKGRKTFQLDVRAPSLEFFRQTATRSMGTDDKGEIILREKSFLNVRGILKRRLVPAILARRNSDFARIREVTVDEVISEEGEALNLPVPLMSVPQLAAYVESKQLPIDVLSYLDINEIRSDILECELDVDAFFKNKKKRDLKRSEEKKFMELNDMNDAPPIKLPAEPPLKKIRKEPKVFDSPKTEEPVF